MLSVRLMVLGIFAMLLLAACKTEYFGGEPASDAHAERDLARAVKIYEEGDYPAAIAMLQHAIQYGLSNRVDHANAYKYLAFIYCTSAREKQCRESFKKALEINKDFDLQPAEAGHPVWGPVFRSIKGGKSVN